jgi:hypothetical protein
MIYSSPHISRRDWAIQKREEKKRREQREREIAHVSKFQKREWCKSCIKEFHNLDGNN